MVKLNYEMGKPELFLHSLEKTVLTIPTQEDYDDIMMVYQAGRWRWKEVDGRYLPTKLNKWDSYEEETCVTLDVHFDTHNAWYYSTNGWNFIHPPKFYEMNGITQENLTEIRTWFDRHFPKRTSKGK